MNHSSASQPLESIAARVRQNAGSAGFAALCLIYFGFFHFRFPEVKDLFSRGDALFQYTLRGGGIVMGVLAAASLTGRHQVLAVDALISILIGVCLMVSDLMMIAGGAGFGFNQVLYLVFGGMFVSAGLRNGRDYLAIRSIARSVDQRVEPLGEWDDPPTPPVIPSTVQTARATEVAIERRPEYSVPSSADGGFLAGFANKKPPAN